MFSPRSHAHPPTQPKSGTPGFTALTIRSAALSAAHLLYLGTVGGKLLLFSLHPSFPEFLRLIPVGSNRVSAILPLPSVARVLVLNDGIILLAWRRTASCPRRPPQLLCSPAQLGLLFLVDFRCGPRTSASPPALLRNPRFAGMGAYVSLLEYNNVESMILFSELSRCRIRSISSRIKVSNLITKMDDSEL
ncbi:hypothetical protein QYE76_041218 [Lolium multiflorum]|uniref:Uncharacterized protein n=1 Tax=Lolium multiflorum TaxID=4521 RepID=A0AAD8WTS4_LOLMU|nr:hypothetical protein QYE76_041218 [Lolium multiflorum]